MKTLYKYGYLLLCSIFIVGVLFFSLRYIERKEAAPAANLSFCIEKNGQTLKSSVYRVEDGYYCVFLPSWADMEHVKVAFNLPAGRDSWRLNGKELERGMDCAVFEENMEYELETPEGVSSLIFLRSANVASLHIDTDSGSLEYLHRDRRNEEQVQLSLYTAEGNTEQLNIIGVLQGRGNSSWNRAEKKPYSLKLLDESQLLGMSGKNFVLLANALDDTKLHNKIVLDMIGKLPTAYAPDCAYVDVWVNGEYTGLYLLTEKVETGKDRLQIEDDPNSFLCKFEYNYRWDSMDNPFLTQNGRTVDVCFPEAPDANRMEAIKREVNYLEETVLSGENLALAMNIDLDSWARRYVIDEFSSNIDSDKASSYFYFLDGIIYAGPLWDYDLTFGRVDYGEENLLIALPAGNDPTNTLSYNYVLWQNPSFRAAVKQIYEEELRPLAMQLCESEIERLAKEISAAAQMDNMRWWPELYFAGTQEQLALAEGLAEFVRARISFLDSLWLEGVEYHSIRIENNGALILAETVKDGEYLDVSGLDLDDMIYTYAGSDTLFDYTEPIHKSAYVYAKSAEEMSVQEEPTKAALVESGCAVLLAAFFAVFFAVLLIRDYRQRRQDRRNSNV